LPRGNYLAGGAAPSRRDVTRSLHCNSPHPVPEPAPATPGASGCCPGARP